MLKMKLNSRNAAAFQFSSESFVLLSPVSKL